MNAESMLALPASPLRSRYSVAHPLCVSTEIMIDTLDIINVYLTETIVYSGVLRYGTAVSL